MNKKPIKRIFITNHIQFETQEKHEKCTIGNQPPKNKIIINDDINKILAYSAKKKNTKPTEAYSTL